jgi:hypothetical protein
LALDAAFWPALWSLVALPSGTRPEVLLAVWLYESDLDPTAQNGDGCIGLNQTCPAALGGPGFPGGDGEAQAYRSAPASAQLAWIAPQVLRGVALNGGPFESAARYFQANLLPATLATARARGDVIAARAGPYAAAYAANAQLDSNGDGAITLDDLGHALQGKALASGNTLADAIASSYAAAPPGAPWASPALAIFEPPQVAPAIARSGGRGAGAVVVAFAGIGGLLAALARHR